MPKIYGSSEIWGDLLVTGSFSILGSASSIYTTSLVVSDTIISLGHSQSGSPLLDEGIMFNRGTGLTQAFIWDETNDTFALIGTNDDHTVIGSVNIDSYSNLRVGGITTSNITITNGATSGYVLTSDASGNATWQVPSGGSGGGLTGSGTNNYLAKWNNTGGLIDSIIYNNGNNVGINSWAANSTMMIASTNEFVSLNVENSTLTNGWDPTSKYGINTFLNGFGSSLNNIGIFSGVSDGATNNFGFYSAVSGPSGSSNYAYYSVIDSSGTNNYGLYIDSYNATNNYGIVVNRGTTIFNESGNANSDFRIEGDSDSNLFFADASTDRIGIGTNTPLYKVQVSGTVSTTGFRMTNGASNGSYLRSDSSGNATWASIPGGLTGSGTTNYIPRWTATSTLSSTSTIYDDGTNVGLGTTSPTSKLNVVVNSASTSNIGIKSQVSNGNFSNYGLEITSSGPSSGTNYGLFSTVFGSNGQNTGIYSIITGTYGTTNTGISTLISASASSENIGQSVRVSGGTKNTGISIGLGSGLGISADTGLLNYVETSFVSKQTTINGIYNDIQGSATNKYGIRNTVTGTNSTTNFGIYNAVQGASNTNYGIFSIISGTYGTNYAFYASISGSNSNTFAHYVDMQSTSTNNYGMLIDVQNATNNYGVVVNRGTSIFNENGDANTDFRIEGDTNSNLFFVDASADNIGIATSNPIYRLQVSGTVSSTGLYNNGGLRNKITDPGSNAIYTITTNDYIVQAQPLGSYVTFSLPLTPPTGTEIIITKQQSGTVSILTLGSESMVRGNSGGLTAINWNPGIYGMSKFIFMGGFWHTDAT
jgi:hypothetical protein